MSRSIHTITPVAERIPASPPSAWRNPLDVSQVPVEFVGSARELFSTVAQGDTLAIQPKSPLPARCTVRPVALFENGHCGNEANTVMGRLLFQPGAEHAQTYQPFTLDPMRRLRRLWLLTEQTPDDDLYASEARWRNWEAVAADLLQRCDISWGGLSSGNVRHLLELEPWQQPLEGCILHALTQWSHKVGQKVIEIGSLRGQSTSMLAMALRGVGSDLPLVSIDPHLDQPFNEDQVRLTLAQIGEQERLEQITRTSDAAASLFEPESASLVFVDGNHSYEQVLADFRNFGGVLAPGGWLLFHDYGYGNHNGKADVVPDVRPAIDEILKTEPGFRPVLLAHTLLALVKEAR